MQIRGLRHVVIVTVAQFAVLPRVDVLDRREVPRARRIIDGVEVDPLRGDSLTRAILVRAVSPHEHHVDDPVPEVVQLGPEQPIIVQKQEVTPRVDQPLPADDRDEARDREGAREDRDAWIASVTRGVIIH